MLVIYNFALSLLSLYTLGIFILGLISSPYVYYKGHTEEIEYAMKVYWITKIIELLDTVFMALRHKSRQITFLHVYHHASMLVLSDYGYHLSPWPAIALILSINSFVHVVLYFYYGLTAYNPSSVPSWKPRITELQIFQFFVAFIYAWYGFKHHGFCVYGFIYGIVMTTLFCNFYYQAYIKRKAVKSAVQNGKVKGS